MPKKKMTEQEINSDKSLELYKIIRDYISHEDSLINNRLTWLLTIQGLLFTAYGVFIKLDSNSEPKIEDLDLFISILKTLGIWTSLLGFMGILAALLAIEQLEKKYESNSNNHEFPLKDKLPDITGGGNRVAHIIGSFTPLAIPYVFFLVWFFLLKDGQFSLTITIPCMVLLLFGLWIVFLLIYPHFLKKLFQKIITKQPRNRSQ